MKAKLIKNEGDFYLCIPHESTNEFIGSTNGMYVQYKVSLKNCQSIERGYDLDKLINRAFDNMGYHSTVTPYEEKQFKLGYKIAFREALELMGDKKFSEEDMGNLWDFCVYNKGTFKEYIQSLQQTEWDVTFDPEKLDADGCLILKNI